MGVRIRKDMGYALTDLKCKNLRIDDPRFLKDHVYLSEDISELRTKDFVEFVEAKIAKLDRDNPEDLDRIVEIQDGMLHANSREYAHELIESLIIFNPEAGDSNVFLFQPPGFNKLWSRSNDPIDYVEAEHNSKDKDYFTAEPEYFVHSKGFHLYDDIYIDKRDGRRIDQAAAYKVNTYANLQTGSGANKIAYRDRLAEEAGFNNYGELEANMVPGAPEVIYLLNEYLGLFTPETMWDLRPVVYTHWS